MNFEKTTTAHVFKEKKGFSLIELLVAMVIMSVVSLAIYSVFSVSSRTYTTQGVTADVQQSVRAAMEVMLQDIRSAGLDPTSSGNFGIELAENTKLRFTSDSIDAGIFNGALDDTNSERITYVLQGTQLDQILYETTASADTEPLISDVQNLTFTYFDAIGNDLGSPVPALQLADIRTINVSITVVEPAGRDASVRWL
jgi:prepilin-type N-terminal cleavage/methylation domain-containing protein